MEIIIGRLVYDKKRVEENHRSSVCSFFSFPSHPFWWPFPFLAFYIFASNKNGYKIKF